MKKILTMFIALIMLFSTTVALAANTRTSGLYTYEIKGNGTITITDFDWNANDGDVFIPNMIDGYTVTAIGDEAFFLNESPQHAEISVTIPDSIKSIGAKAFWNTNISGINIPDSVQLIGYGAFAGCPKCQFKLSPSQKYFACIDDCLYNKSKKELIACSWRNQVDWDKNFFYLEGEIRILDGIQSIGDYALCTLGNINGIEKPGKFQNVQLYLPPSVKSIGNYALAWADIYRLSGSVVGVESLGNSAFEATSILGDRQGQVHKFNSLKHMGEKAIYGLSLTNVVFDFSGSPLSDFPDNTLISNYGEFLFNVNNFERIGVDNPGLGSYFTSPNDFSSKLTSIPEGLVPNVSELPDSITRIESHAFYKVSDFKLSPMLTYIATDAFHKGSSFIVESGSYAELWCSENGFGYTVEGQNNLDWLTGGSTQIAEEKKNAIPAGYHEVVGVGQGMMGDIEVKVITNENKIISVEVLSCNDTIGIREASIDQIPYAIVAANSTDVDCHTGATLTGHGIIEAVEDALMQLPHD